jgi:hypothetical protein
LAHFWGQVNFAKHGYVICQASIDDAHDVLWNIDGRTEHQEEFINAWNMLLSDGFIKNPNDVIVSDVIMYLQEKGLIPYLAIRAADEDRDTCFMQFMPKNKQKPAQMRLKQRVQICLIEKSDITLRDFKIIYPNHYI